MKYVRKTINVKIPEWLKKKYPHPMWTEAKKRTAGNSMWPPRGEAGSKQRKIHNDFKNRYNKERPQEWKDWELKEQRKTRELLQGDLPTGSNCLQCGAWFDFTIKEYVDKIPFLNRVQKYCNRACYLKHWRAKKKGAILERSCESCGKMFKLSTRRYKSKSPTIKRFCDRKCRDNEYRKTKSYKKSHKEANLKYKEKPGVKEKVNKQTAQRRRTDLDYSIRLRVRGNMSNSLKRYLNGVPQQIKKAERTEKLMGCSFEKLKQHLESKFTKGMTWEKFLKCGKNGIHIDHIKPCASFDLTKESEQKKCFHYTNLQPLWAIDNFKKGAKIAA